MKLLLINTLLFILSLTCQPLAVAGHPMHMRGEVDVSVVDDMGSPVSNATVSARFHVLTNDEYAGPRIKNQTDTNGICRIVGEGYERLGLWVRKNGYYDSRLSVHLGDYELAKKTRLWPTKRCTVILKKRRNPIPMYAKRVAIGIPSENTYYGFDLLESDWVAPHGKGARADVYFRFSMDRSDVFHVTNIVNVAITDKMCGIQKLNSDEFSQFKTLHQAPEKGYQRELEFSYMRSRVKIFKNTVLKDHEYLVFKCRPEYDEEGNLLQAHYGKICHPLKVGQDPKTLWSELRFLYYFNPTPNDRNIEFAPGKSLFPLSRSEIINAP